MYINKHLQIFILLIFSVVATAQETKKCPVDTLITKDDKYTGVVLFSDSTWTLVDLGRPQFDDDDISEDWETEKIHAFRELTIADLPEVDTLHLLNKCAYAAPIKGHVRSGFMFRRRRPHYGTDIPLIVGTPIYSAFDGKVRVVRKTRNAGGYGNLVVVRHPNGLETYYGHLSSHAVKEGDIVKAGEVIGYGGNTGRSTGPHLHFEARYKGKPFDSQRIIDFETGQLRDSVFVLKRHYFNIYSHYGQTDEESLKASERQIHTVRSGDTLGGLARKYHTTVSNICKLNKMSSKKTLRIGQRLIVR
ncbi:MAG: peptidoglycan DD-metalloendopeptidase family protein [Marinilabiliaceae bacterium]|nr:peptidoglycan DD-metalloendopeptidase family protein [Marinilabiliaceae bacterium]